MMMLRSGCCRPRWRFSVAVAVVACAFASAQPTSVVADVLVFAAASTTGAIEQVAEAYMNRGLGTVRSSVASSSSLARQIAAGAPADIFVSANVPWMDYLTARNAIEPETQHDLFGNRLVLIAPRAAQLTLRFEADFPLVEALNGKPLAMGDPDHVPAGMYAKTALVGLGLWDMLATHIAPMPDVRAALALVERGEASAGVVYATDALASSRVSVVATFPADSHPPILYRAAVIAGRDRTEVRRFMTFLTSSEAMEIYAKHGFVRIAGTKP